MASDLTSAGDLTWSAEGTTPFEVEAALRRLLQECHAVAAAACVPARALNLVCVVHSAVADEVARRLLQVGRYHASRTILCSVEPGRTRMDATATITARIDPRPGELALLLESVVLRIGERHLPHLDTVVDPLVITDLPTVLWAPDHDPRGLGAVLRLAQVVLVDSVARPDVGEALRQADQLLGSAYVVDLAWLRSTPWRERVAATFDPPELQRDLRALSALTVRHEPGSTAAGLLLAGWLASRLGWRTMPLEARDGALAGELVGGRRRTVRIRLERDPGLGVPGLAGVTLDTASGRRLTLDRGPGGLRACHREPDGRALRWTILGASRGEGGVLGEGIRQALLRDPAYGPALAAAGSLVPDAARRSETVGERGS